jgi:phosphoribosylaminoimidazole-succinocarboxamide synthase
VLISQTELPGVNRVAQGKVRDIFEIDDRLLIVATDRLSAFDVVLPDPIPGKGAVLTGLSEFWFRRFAGLITNHMITTDPGRFPAALRPFEDQLAGRSMLVRKARPLPVECVVRGYLAGSGWKEYQRSGRVCGIELPAGLCQADKLPEPVFTPSTKATMGHDENIPFSRMVELVGQDVAARARHAALSVYVQAEEYARTKGIIIADTKFEFGLVDDELILIDEALTPDSSRFWDAAAYRPGMSPESYDKQFVRDYLERIGWNKTPPAPRLAADVIEGTSRRYREAFSLITGRSLS